MREFELSEKIKLPNCLSEKYLDGYYIVIASDNPNWLVLNKDEHNLFCILKEQNSISNSLEMYYNLYSHNEEKCLSLMTKLLSQIDKVNFTGEASISEEEDVSKIKKMIHLNVTNGCNMRCKHCYMSAGLNKINNIDVGSVKRFITALRKIYGVLDIVISGGEPLIHPRINELLKFFKQDRTLLFSNGTLITKENINIISNCCSEVQISLEGITKEAYGYSRGNENYEKMLNAIDLLMKYNMKIVLAITILPNTLDDIKNNLIEFVKKLDYRKLEIRINDEIEMTGNAVTLDMTKFDVEKSHTTIIKLVKELKSLGCNIANTVCRNVRYTNCGIGTNFVINDDGKIYPCSKFSSIYYNINDNIDTLIKEFDNLNNKTTNIIIEQCQSCELKYICSGGCRIDNLNNNGNMLKVSCNEKYKVEKYRELIYEYKMHIEE